MATKKTTLKKKQHPKAQRIIWFKTVRGSYIPVSWEGWLLYLPFTVYLISASIYGFQDTNSTLEAMMFVVPNWVAAAAVMTWIAKRLS